MKPCLSGQLPREPALETATAQLSYPRARKSCLLPLASPTAHPTDRLGDHGLIARIAARHSFASCRTQTRTHSSTLAAFASCCVVLPPATPTAKKPLLFLGARHCFAPAHPPCRSLLLHGPPCVAPPPESTSSFSVRFCRGEYETSANRLSGYSSQTKEATATSAPSPHHRPPSALPYNASRLDEPRQPSFFHPVIGFPAPSAIPTRVLSFNRRNQPRASPLLLAALRGCSFCTLSLPGLFPETRQLAGLAGSLCSWTVFVAERKSNIWGERGGESAIRHPLED